MARQRVVMVRNLGRYQHYKQRNPPWVKLYRDFFTDYPLSTFDPSTRLLSLVLIIVASETENRVRIDEEWLANRASISVESVKIGIKTLLDAGFLASTSLASPKQNLPPSTEVEIETPLPPFRSNGRERVWTCDRCGLHHKSEASFVEHRYVVHDIPRPAPAEEPTPA